MRLMYDIRGANNIFSDMHMFCGSNEDRRIGLTAWKTTRRTSWGRSRSRASLAWIHGFMDPPFTSARGSITLSPPQLHSLALRLPHALHG